MTRKNKTYISTENFLRSCVSASSAEEVANNLGVDVKYVLKRVGQLRKSGVKMQELKTDYMPMRSGRKTIDAEQIYRLVKECQAATIGQTKTDTLSASINRAINDANN